MDKIEKIRQEIERHRQAIRVLNEHTTPDQISKTCAIFQYSDTILSELLSFLDSLSEESSCPKELDNLEEAAIDFADFARKQLFSKDYAVSSIAYYDHGCIDGFKAGAEWQRKKDTRDMYMSDNRHFQKVYELGKKDMKEQMMKEAVEGEIFDYIEGLIGNIEFDIDSRFEKGDKVHIIIVKEDK